MPHTPYLLTEEMLFDLPMPIRSSDRRSRRRFTFVSQLRRHPITMDRLTQADLSELFSNAKQVCPFFTLLLSEALENATPPREYYSQLLQEYHFKLDPFSELRSWDLRRYIKLIDSLANEIIGRFDRCLTAALATPGRVRGVGGEVVYGFRCLVECAILSLESFVGAYDKNDVEVEKDSHLSYLQEVLVRFGVIVREMGWMTAEMRADIKKMHTKYGYRSFDFETVCNKILGTE